MLFQNSSFAGQLDIFKKKYSNFLFFPMRTLELYQFVMLTDFMVTDYYSISVKYLLLDKPMVFTLDEDDEYKNSRAFFFDNVKEIIVGYYVYNEDEMMSDILEVCDEKDSCEE